jgi:predicted dehydrogenase
MNGHDPIPRLRIGMVGSGFIANFHLQALVNVRHVTVTGIYSPNAAHREALAAKANALELGPCRAFPSLEAMLISGEVDAVWIGVPNFARLETMREIYRLVTSRWAKLVGVACEKPLGRTLAEAREMLRLAEDGQAAARLSGKSGLLQRGAARQGYRVAARGAGLRTSLSGPRRRGT